MTRVLVSGILAFVLASASLAGEGKNTFVSADLGISMEVPMSTDPQTTNHQVAMFFLPPSDGFAANVNIQRQRYDGSIEDYDKLSAQQFEEFKFTVLNRKLDEDQVTYEYKGDVQGKSLHWYARAIKQAQHVYLVTATCLDSCWPAQKEYLSKSVASFKVQKQP